MPKLSYAHLGDDHKLVYERALETVIFERFLSSELLEEYKAPLFYVTSDDFLCCTAAFVKEYAAANADKCFAVGNDKFVELSEKAFRVRNAF